MNFTHKDGSDEDRYMDNRLDNLITDIGYLWDCLRTLRDIWELNDCNKCAKKRECEYAPKPGQIVRFNCPLFEKNLAEDERRPDSKKHYDVWLEGFSCTGQYCADEFLGNYIADSFKEACKLALEEHYSDADMKKFYNEEKNTFYGCKMYEYNPGHF